MGTLIKSIMLALGLGVGATMMLPAPARNDVPAAVEVSPEPASRSVEDDPRVRALVQAYAPLIDSVVYLPDDAVFVMGTEPIHFRDGRMLAESRLDREEECDPIFYEYPLGPMTAPAPPALGDMPTYCTDMLESLWGDTETEIRRHGRSVRFLDHRMFVNELLIEPLATVERDIRNVAQTDRAVAAWVDDLDITYSFTYREIAGSETRSQHSFGLAVDFVPRSYHGRAVYWRWSQVLDREGWYEIPMAMRWSPPQRVISIFERHGFIWGGKWLHFDGIHFEYRPEILLYNRLAQP